MQAHFFRPSVFLAPYVDYYFVVENFSSDENLDASHGVVVFPSPQGQMVFSYGDEAFEKWLGEDLKPSPGFAVSGYSTKSVEYFSPKLVGVIMVGFKPWGIQAFLDFELKHITNTNSGMDIHFGKEVVFVEEMLHEAGNMAERLRIVEAFLAGKLRRPLIDKAMVHAVGLISQSNGVIPVEHLAKECFMSRRNFLRRFEASIGINPKMFSRLVRFQQVFAAMDAHPKNADWGQIAYDAGYFDQAHFINDFKELSGMSPLQFQEKAQPTEIGRLFDANVGAENLYGKVYL
ncbi:MAG: helix-turn-helix domain-containing protein [Saprospiraceae bacterium]